ncbi:hypothetical protein HRbin27_00549 [bacterium HR27]|nr:hypothetical protein HRbin27_00549 [bacterium HR27]
MLPPRVCGDTQGRDTRRVAKRPIGHDRDTTSHQYACCQDVTEYSGSRLSTSLDHQHVARLDRFDHLTLRVPLRFSFEQSEQVGSGREIPERPRQPDEAHIRPERPDVLQELIPISPAVELCPECRGAHSRQLLSQRFSERLSTVHVLPPYPMLLRHHLTILAERARGVDLARPTGRAYPRSEGHCALVTPRDALPWYRHSGGPSHERQDVPSSTATSFSTGYATSATG